MRMGVFGRVVLAAGVWAWAACASAGIAVAQEKPAAPANQASGYEISGTLINAISGDPLSKAKVWVVPVPDPDQQDDVLPQQGPARGPGGGRGPGAAGGGGAGFGGGGDGRNFAGGRGLRG